MFGEFRGGSASPNEKFWRRYYSHPHPQSIVEK